MKQIDPQATQKAVSGLTSPEDDSGIDLSVILGVLWRGRWLLLLAAVLSGALGFYNAFFVAVPEYRATASLILNTQREQVVDIESVISGASQDATSINTQLEVIKSRELVGKLVRELDLVTDPEFNTALRPPAKFSLRNMVKGVVNSIRSSSTSEDELNDAADRSTGTSDPASDADSEYFDSVVSVVRSKIGAGAQRGTYILLISARTTDRKKSQLLANTLADLYIQDQIDVKFQATENAITWLSQRVAELEDELDVREDELKALRNEATVSSVEGLLALNAQLQDLRSRLNTAQSLEAEAEARFDELSRIADLPPDLQREELLKVDDPILQRLARQAGNQNAQQLLEDRLASTRTDARQQQQRANAQIQTIQTAISDLEATLDTQTTSLQRLRQVEREAQATRTLYETFLTRLKETSVQRGLNQADSRLLSAATPGVHVAPQKSRIVAIYMMLGLLAVAVYLFAMQFLHNGLRVADDLEKLSQRPVLGQIPLMPNRARNALLDFIADNPTSVTAEAYRNLRTSLLLSDLDHQPQVIMVTSSVPGEGKTTNSISLAHNFSGLGKRVLLVECDIRRQTLSLYFEGLYQNEGLLSAMTSNRPLEDFIIHDERIGADILLGERSHVNAADTFSSETFHAFLRSLRQHYDYIILDTPPVLVAPDARIVGQSADAVLYAVAWNRTTKRQVKEGLQLLDMVNVPVTGMVMTMIDPNGMKRYGYGNSYGSYAYRNTSYYNT